MKRIIVALLFLTIAIGCVSGVSAVFHNYHNNGTAALIDSSVSVSCEGPVKSDEYAYYYQGSGSYAEDAYWYALGIDGSITVDVKKLYNNTNIDKSNYSLKDFKKDLKHNLKNMSIGAAPYNVNDSDITATLSDDSSVLTVSFSGYDEHYVQKVAVKDIKNYKKKDEISFMMLFSEPTDYADFDYNYNFTVPVYQS